MSKTDTISLHFGIVIDLNVKDMSKHKRPKLQLRDDILRNNSYGEIIRVCMRIFTTAPRNKKQSNSQ